MKTLFFSLLFSVFSITGYNQTCGTIISQGAVPNPVDENDSVWLNVQAYCTSNMWLDHYTVTPSGNSFMINAFYCIGMLTVITYTNDSIPLGILPAGSYTYIVNTNTSGDCITFTTADQDAGNFVVDPVGGTGISTSGLPVLSISPNPFTDFIEISAGNKISEIELFDINSKKINIQNTFFSSDKITLNTAALLPGIYFLSMTIDGNKYYRKIIK